SINENTLLREQNTTVLENLQREHVVIEDMIDDAIAASGAERLRIFNEAKLRLRKHMEAEEEVFYPAVVAISDDASEAVDTALIEHTTIKANLTTLEGAMSTPNLETLKDNVVAHVVSERAIIFDFAREALTHNQLNVLADGVTAVEDASVLT